MTPPSCLNVPRRERIRLRNHTIAATIAGQGEPVVLLHGWPQTSHAWRHVVPLLAERYTVIAPDLPGFGESSHPSTGFDKKTIAGVVRELLTTLGHSSIRLVGHDVGGQVAYAYAASWPQEVSHLTMIECGIPGIMEPSVANPLLGGSWHYAFNMMSDLNEALVAGRERVFLRYVLWRDQVGLFNAQAITDGDLDVYEAGLRQPGGLRSSFAYYRSLPQDAQDNRDWVQRPLSTPVQLIGAEHSYGESWLSSMGSVAERIETALIAASGHYPPEEQPALLVSHLSRFFES